MSYFTLLQIGELSNSDGRFSRPSTRDAGSFIGQLRLCERIQGRKGGRRKRRRARGEGTGWNKAEWKDKALPTKCARSVRPSPPERKETVRTTRKTTHTGGRTRTDRQHQSRGRNRERNLRKEFSWTFICCVILLLGMKAKASCSFIPYWASQ